MLLLLVTIPANSQSRQTTFGGCEISDYAVYYVIVFKLKEIRENTRILKVFVDGQEVGEVKPVFALNHTYHLKIKRRLAL